MDYWSCTKFADWLRGISKPVSGTTEEWNEWEDKASKKKIHYWLAKDGLDYLQKIFYLPSTIINNVYHYLDNRWNTRTHALTSNLKKGQWHEFDERLLHSAFDELVNFVEVEQAWFHIICTKEDKRKYKISWYHSIVPFCSYRCPAAGLAHLEWAASHDEAWNDPNDPDFEKPTHQALAAREIIELYKWWKEERPKRADPMDASGWSDYCDKRRKESENHRLFRSDCSEADKEQKRKILDLCSKLEQEQENEDTNMLIRLVQVRHNIWT